MLTAGQPIPVDGVVVQGTATVDQHRLTGESQPVEKATGDSVLAATLVLGGTIRVRVEKTGAETAAAHIGDVLNRTVEHQEIRLSDQFKAVEKYRWPMLAGGALGWLVRGPTTGAAMLGCNFMLSQIPLRLLTLLNGLATGAERGILIKDGRALDRLAAIDTVVFDKTGTLTLERQRLVRIHCCPKHAEDQVLAFAAAAEQRQSHPIALAILAAAAERQLTLPEQKAERVQALQAQGKQVCFIGDGINDAIALRQSEVSISLRGATTVATDAAQVVLMDDDLTQLRLLWELAKGFQHSLTTNALRAKQWSLLAAAGVLALPFGFWVVGILGGVQIITGITIAKQPLLIVELSS